jgi:hypothetical protein
MIIDWINHPHYKRDQWIMAILYHCRMASKRQLAVISGLTEKEIEWSQYRIREFEKVPKTLKILLEKRKNEGLSYEEQIKLRILKKELKEKRDQWIKTYRLPRSNGRDKSVWALGTKGLKYAGELVEETLISPKESKDSQLAHTYGYVDIFTRVMEQKRESVKSWLFEYETVDYLTHLYEKRNKEIKPKIRPDSWARINDQTFWIEYDNGTEGPRALEKKFNDYVVTFTQIMLKNQEVVWVTIDQKRCEYLKKVWTLTRKRFPQNKYVVPTMEFFVAGSETDYLLNGN